MKKIVTLLSFLIVATTIFAQRGKVTSALSYKEAGNLKKAYETIQVAIDPDNERSKKSIDWPRSYEVKGQILVEAFRLGAEDIVEHPLFDAFDAYKKAIELDEGNKFAKSLKIDLTFLQTDLSNYAVAAFAKERFDVALKCFEYFMEISNMPMMKETKGDVVDTAIIYNAGLAAFKAKDWPKAAKYFKSSASYDYNGAASYHFSFQAYQASGDTLGSIKVLKEGFENYPDSESLIVELINFYISTGKADDAVNYLDKAIEGNPENVSYYTAKGGTLEKLGREEDAIVVYKEAIELDSTLFTPYYNLGVIYYNRGVNVLNEASQLPPSQTKEYDEMILKGKGHLRDALPYIEKAYQLDDSEIAILESLRLIYYRLQMNDKYEIINKKIQSISN